jgi:DNA-binding IclR family transcriptional regulator
VAWDENYIRHVDQIFDALRDHPEGLTSRQLVAITGMKPGTASALASRLAMYGRLRRRRATHKHGVMYVYTWPIERP